MILIKNINFQPFYSDILNKIGQVSQIVDRDYSANSSKNQLNNCVRKTFLKDSATIPYVPGCIVNIIKYEYQESCIKNH
jgi:hypothetical protein